MNIENLFTTFYKESLERKSYGYVSMYVDFHKDFDLGGWAKQYEAFVRTRIRTVPLSFSINYRASLKGEVVKVAPVDIGSHKEKIRSHIPDVFLDTEKFIRDLVQIEEYLASLSEYVLSFVEKRIFYPPTTKALVIEPVGMIEVLELAMPKRDDNFEECLKFILEHYGVSYESFNKFTKENLKNFEITKLLDYWLWDKIFASYEKIHLETFVELKVKEFSDILQAHELEFKNSHFSKLDDLITNERDISFGISKFLTGAYDISRMFFDVEFLKLSIRKETIESLLAPINREILLISVGDITGIKQPKNTCPMIDLSKKNIKDELSERLHDTSKKEDELRRGLSRAQDKCNEGISELTGKISRLHIEAATLEANLRDNYDRDSVIELEGMISEINQSIEDEMTNLSAANRALLDLEIELDDHLEAMRLSDKEFESEVAEIIEGAEELRIACDQTRDSTLKARAKLYDQIRESLRETPDGKLIIYDLNSEIEIDIDIVSDFPESLLDESDFYNEPMKNYRSICSWAEAIKSLTLSKVASANDYLTLDEYLKSEINRGIKLAIQNQKNRSSAA